MYEPREVEDRTDGYSSAAEEKQHKSLSSTMKPPRSKCGPKVRDLKITRGASTFKRPAFF
jgi:hypothetical protein